MQAGLHFQQCQRLADFLVGPLNGSWRMPVGVHGKAGFDIRSGATRKLSPILVASVKACGECRRNYINLTVPGSSPGCAFTGTVAQLVEHQARFSTSCRRK